MAQDSAVFEDSVEGILYYLRDYLSVRAQAAGRMNPRIANVVEDIVWVQLQHMRQLLEKQKMFGPDRVRVGDALTQEDENRRKAILSHTDQNAVVYEIINRAEQQKGRVVDMPIHDMRTLFHALEPSLENLVQLVQHWSFWDLPDAADLFHSEKNCRRVNALLQHPITDAIRARYRSALHKRDSESLTDEDIIELELRLLEQIVQRVVARRGEEEPFQMIIRRDEKPGSASDQEIIKIAKHLMALDQFEHTEGEIDAAVREQFAKALHTIPEDATRDRLVDYERRTIAEAKKSLRSYLNDDRFLGEPYDYKKMQMQQLVSRFNTEKERILAAAKEKAPAGPPAPPASAVSQPSGAAH
jgi:hypothetical protein